MVAEDRVPEACERACEEVDCAGSSVLKPSAQRGREGSGDPIDWREGRLSERCVSTPHTRRWSRRCFDGVPLAEWVVQGSGMRSA